MFFGVVSFYGFCNRMSCYRSFQPASGLLQPRGASPHLVRAAGTKGVAVWTDDGKLEPLLGTNPFLIVVVSGF